MPKKKKKWFSEYSPLREWLIAALALAAFTLGFLEYLESRDIQEARLDIEQAQLLDRAWDLIGNRPGTSILQSPLGPVSEENLVKANRLVDEALMLDPNNAQAYLVRGYVFEAALEFDRAKEAYDRAAQDKDYRIAGTMALANLMRTLGNPELSASLYRDLIGKDLDSPDLWLARNNLAAALLEMDEFSEAEKYYQSIVDRYPTNCMMIAFLGMSQYSQEKLNIAEENLLRAVDMCPESQIAQMNLGNVYSRQKEYEKALAAYTIASELGSQKYDGAYKAIGEALLRLNRLPESKAALEQALDRNNKNASAYALLAYIALVQSEFTLSKKLFQQALDVNDAYQETPLSLMHVYTNLSAALIGLREYENAKVYATQALEIDPDIQEAQRNLEIAIAGLNGKNE